MTYWSIWPLGTVKITLMPSLLETLNFPSNKFLNYFSCTARGLTVLLKYLLLRLGHVIIFTFETLCRSMQCLARPWWLLTCRQFAPLSGLSSIVPGTAGVFGNPQLHSAEFPQFFFSLDSHCTEYCPLFSGIPSYTLPVRQWNVCSIYSATYITWCNNALRLSRNL